MCSPVAAAAAIPTDRRYFNCHTANRESQFEKPASLVPTHNPVDGIRVRTELIT